MNNLNIKAKIFLVFLLITAVIFPIISYKANCYFIISIIYCICAFLIAAAIIILSIKTSKFFSFIEKENLRLDEEIKQQKFENGKIVNLSFKEYKHLIKKGFVPIGDDKTEIIELKKDN